MRPLRPATIFKKASFEDPHVTSPDDTWQSPEALDLARHVREARELPEELDAKGKANTHVNLHSRLSALVRGDDRSRLEVEKCRREDEGLVVSLR